MIMGKVVGVCVGRERGTGKVNVGKGHLRKGYGLVGDAHASTMREVSLLSLERIEAVSRAHGVEAKPGDFAENITISGAEAKHFYIGVNFRIGEAQLEVIQIGKESGDSHAYSFHGLALLPKEGIFCRVVRSGQVKVGDIISSVMPTWITGNK